MKIIAVVQQKGGVGKSTIAANLAVAAATGRRKTILIDFDPQGTVTNWWESRDTDSPQLLTAGVGQVTQALDQAQTAGFDVAILDTPPHNEPVIAGIIKDSHFALLPCQPTPLDMQAAGKTVEIVKRTKTAAAFVLSRCPANMKRPNEARSGLAVYGIPVATPYISELVSFQDAWPFGLGVIEYEARGKAASQMLDLWAWVLKRLDKKGALTNG